MGGTGAGAGAGLVARTDDGGSDVGRSGADGSDDEGTSSAGVSGTRGATAEPTAGIGGSSEPSADAAGAAGQVGVSERLPCVVGADLLLRCAISGVVSGLSGQGLVLRDNGGDDLSISHSGDFVFHGALVDGASYRVSVLQQPQSPQQTCAVQNGDGIVNGQSVTSVRVTCSPWTRLLGSYDSAVGRAIESDGRGNLYVAGTTYVTNGADGTNQVILAKLATTGEPLWTRQFGPRGWGNALAIDPAGNPYVAGISDEHGFLAKVDALGKRLWLRDGLDHILNGLAIDGAGNVYACGWSSSDGATLIKYDSNGNLQWTRLLHPSGEDRAYDVAIAGNGQVNVTGFVSGSLDGAVYVGEYGDIFLAAYDAQGNRLWSRQMGGPRDDAANAIAVDSLNNIYLTGHFTDSIGLDTPVIIQYDSAGNHRWTRELRSDEIGRVNAIDIDEQGFAYVAGSREFMALLKLDSHGATVWHQELTAFGGISSAGGITSDDQTGDLYVTGYTDMPTFDGIQRLTLGSIFIVKYNHEGVKQ